MCRSPFFNKVSDWRPATLLKMRLRHRWFAVNFAKYLRKHVLQNTSGSLLLYIYIFWYNKKPSRCLFISEHLFLRMFLVKFALINLHDGKKWIALGPFFHFFYFNKLNCSKLPNFFKKNTQVVLDYIVS